MSSFDSGLSGEKTRPRWVNGSTVAGWNGGDGVGGAGLWPLQQSPTCGDPQEWKGQVGAGEGESPIDRAVGSGSHELFPPQNTKPFLNASWAWWGMRGRASLAPLRRAGSILILNRIRKKRHQGGDTAPLSFQTK